MQLLPTVATVTSLRLLDQPLQSINSQQKTVLQSNNNVILTRIANRHVSLEVTPDQYNVVGGTLLASLEVAFHHYSLDQVTLCQDVLGKEVFNAEVKEAVAEVMLIHHQTFSSP